MAEIDSYVSEIDSFLSPCGKVEEPCGWYSNLLTINEDGRGWRAVGTYQKKITFWYSDQPEFAEHEFGDEKMALAKVSVRISSTYEYQEDIYFKNGIPVFYNLFIPGEILDAPMRFYFDSSHSFNSWGPEKIPFSKDVDGTRKMKYANQYMTLFLLSFTTDW